MKTDVVKPKDIFYNPTQLTVPLFQRPYVWSKDTQWSPLWQDIVRLIEVLEQHNQDATHFLGAIVIQQVPTKLGDLPTWNVIDGQQRLTTIQLLLNALRGELDRRGFVQLAGQILPLVENPPDYLVNDNDRFKLWPTNRDRDGFVSVMAASPPVDHNVIPPTRLSEAHRFFTEAITNWLDGGESPERRARSLVATLQDRLEIASIRLDSNEDAQAIFETLNARGTPLSAADLIKNFVFQNYSGSSADAEKAYHEYWAEFETPWWEKEIATGRVKNSRASLFLWQWLIARTLSDFPLREVFTQFKHYVNTVAKDMAVLLPQIKAGAERYRSIIEGSSRPNGELSRQELFSYRIGTLDSEIARPLLIWLDEPEQDDMPREIKDEVLAILESWFVRRALVKAPAQGTNRLLVDLLQHLSKQPLADIAQATRQYLIDNHTVIGFWPGDDEVRQVLESNPAFTRYVRARLRMILEALEDEMRGYPDGHKLAMSPVVRGKGTVEHIMPQNWQRHWPKRLDAQQEELRNLAVQQLGNLTLVTQKLNSKVSNSSWANKKKYFLKHDDLLLTKDAISEAPDGWDEAAIGNRTSRMIDQILAIWPAPEGHVGMTGASAPQAAVSVDVAELVSSGWLDAGTKLVSRHQSGKFSDATATVAQDGRIYVGDTPYATPTGASTAVGARNQNGWWWWVAQKSGKSLYDIRGEYLASLGEADAEVTDEYPGDDGYPLVINGFDDDLADGGEGHDG